MSSTVPGRALAFALALDQMQTQEPVQAPVPKERVLSDDDLMALVQRKDAAALECLFHRYSRLVLRIARGIVRDSSEAEDVVQDSFVYLYSKASLFDPSKGNLKNWLMQISLHRALDHKSRLARRGFYAGTDLGSLDDVLIGETDLDREIGVKLDGEQLRKAFDQLPRLQRETLELFYFQGLNLREISRKIEDSLGNTRHHFYRGLERLRRDAFVQRLRDRKNA